MKIILFGGTGMVGQGVLRECLLAPDVSEVLVIGRGASGQRHPKLRDLVLAPGTGLGQVDPALLVADACFYCLGVSSAGMSEAAYTEVTYELTLAAASTLAELNPGMTFIYVSGGGTDSTERGRSMWARVKGRTENALLRLPFKAAYMLRPGVIQPLHGVRSKTRSYRLFYAFAAPLLPLLRKLLPRTVLSTEIIGLAMLELARRGGAPAVLESGDIYATVASR